LVLKTRIQLTRQAITLRFERSRNQILNMSNEQYTVLYTARRNRLNEGLCTISDWCAKRAEGNYDDSTTITMLLRKVNELPHQVDKAGWRALDEFNKQNNETH
jgi:hypothetical protein